jgi:ELWxxDGT repeat protein
MNNMKKLTLLISLFITIDSIAQQFSLLKEINTTFTSNGIPSLLMQKSGNTVYFLASDGINGTELWKSDGTEAGTVMVKDITPGAGSTGFSNMMVGGGGLLFFVADDPVNGREPWISDGTVAGTFLLKDINPGTATSGVIRCVFHHGFFYFGADDGVRGQELWKSDGTTAGTVLVKDITPGSGPSSPGAANTNTLYNFVPLGNDIYFTAGETATGRELWKTDGTAAGTVIVKDINPGTGSGLNISNHKAAVFNGRLYFIATDGTNGTELWSTDGTAANTLMVKDIVAGGGNSFPSDFTVFNNEMFFTAASVSNGNPDLWKTDGTAAGTVLVRSLSADGLSLTTGNTNALNFFTVAGGKLFFRGISNTVSGSELYASDGTTAGTGLVKDIFPGSGSSVPQAMLEFNSKLYFTAFNPDLLRTVLYTSDGTEAGTQPVVNGSTASTLLVQSGFMVATSTKMFFYGNDPDGTEIWASDGTSPGTARVKDINTIITGTPNSTSNLSGAILFNGHYYFAAASEAHLSELWKSDGTTAGTVMVKDIWPGQGPSVPSGFTIFNGALYFTANDGVNGNELWKTDGTEAGTIMVKDIAPGAMGTQFSRLAAGTNYLYFTAYHPLYGAELWQSDGTAAGTQMMIDLISGPVSGSSPIFEGVTMGNDTYVYIGTIAGNSLGIAGGNKLLKIDGTTNAISELNSVITAVIDIHVFNNTLYITGRNASNQTILWKYVNGGALQQVKILSTIATNAYQLTDCNGKIYFSASNGAASGMEPWISDGTDAGTYMIKDINPGANPSTPYQFVSSGGKVFFSASSTGNTNGEYELWATDGTEAGTYLVKDILTGNTGSRPNATIAIPGNKVLFTASDGASGIELWKSDGTAAGTSLLRDFNSGSGDGFNQAAIAFNFPADYVLKKLNGNILFFARSVDKGFQLYSGNITGRYKYVNDNSAANDIFTSAFGSNSNNGSQEAPYATISYAVSQAQEGDTIYVDAGIFTEQVTIDKGITLIGAGSGVTIVWKPAVTNPPPGPFLEQGTIQSAQNIGDVHIRDMSVTGDDNGVTPIILQTGGSVKNCRLIGGNQGIYFRVDPAVKSALIENNYINVAYIGINCQGSGLTAILLNNTIELNNPFFTAGVYAGLDFGPIVRFTAFGNSINNYRTQGFNVNSYNTNITQNSILGPGSQAISQSVNVLSVATCNWYGTTDAATIASKISGSITYTPYLNSGTNTNTVYGNYSFVPIANSCSEGVSNYYVNDNNTINDVFTTAMGNNANAGTRSAPFATLSYAISVVPANSVIHVDAGTYAEQVIIDKGIVINGAGKDLTNFIKPATPLVPAPGPFTEIGLIETTQGIGDVHIRNISVNSIDGSSQNIIIQSGGSVKNCKLLNGGQGIFFRVDPVTIPGSFTATIENNIIEPAYIGINCQGSGLTAFIRNNNISKAGTYSAAIFAGLDFGPLPSLTISNNIFHNYNNIGLEVNSYGGNYNNNSFAGTNGAPAIRKFSGNTPNATCNWFGSAHQNTVIPQIQGAVSYSPWLTNGNDNSTDPGFQPVPGVCVGRQNKFYVNNNDITGDVFTSAVGNDANSGIPAAPLLTLEAAYFKALTGDTIYVDAGSYIFNADYFIQKEITFIGANYNISPNDPLDKEKSNAARNKETELIALSLSIKVSNVSFQGFTFDPGNRTPFTANDPLTTNFRLLKNRFKINSALNQVHLVGSGTPQSTPAEMVNTNVNITDNRFEKYGVNTGTTIVAQLFKNITISDNSFVTNGAATSFEHTAMALGFDDRPVDEVYVTNNLFDSLGSVMIGSRRLGHVVVSGNRMHDTRHLYNFANSYPHNSEFEFSGNVFESSLGIPVMTYNRQGGESGTSSIYKVENNIIDIVSPGTSPVLANTPLNTTVAASVINPSVILRGNKISFAGDFGLIAQDLFRPIVLRWNLRNVLIEKNEITYSGTNIGSTSSNNLPVRPAISFYTDNGVGQTIPSGSVINILNNKIQGFRESVIFYDPNGGPTSSSNPFIGYGNLTNGVTVNINNNSFTGDVVSINNGTNSQNILATCNWYGSAATQNIIYKVSLSTVEIAPWLTNGTDNDVATGFQPVPGSCDGYPPLIVLDSYSNVTCNGANNGTINITTTYGKAPFTYTWTKDGDPGFVSHAEDPTGLAPGVYHLSVLDGNGSNIYITDNETDGPGTIDVTITEPSLLTANASGTNVNCFNGTNGTASVLAGGGTAPYTYLWSNGAITSSISDLAAGIYSVTITDDNGCTAQANYEVTQPALLTAAITNNSTGCYNAAKVTPNGGTAPYTYLWSNGATTDSIGSVPPGNYNVTITDAKGCTANASITLAVGEAFNPSASVTNVGCFGGANGKITVTNANGVAPFSYSINGVDFRTINTFDSLTAGTYTISVRDVNGCTGFVTKTITQPAQLVVTEGTVQRTCIGSNTGSISVVVSGGSPSYSYLWTGPGTYSSTQSSISGLAAGNYSVTVTDSKGCTATLPVTVLSFPVITVNANVTNVLCRSEANGSIDLTVTGGTGNGFTYAWNGATTQDRFNLSAGTYNVTVTDVGSGCIVQGSYEVKQAGSQFKFPNGYPIVTNVRGCTPADLGTITASATGGVRPCLFKLGNGSYQVDSVFTGLAAGNGYVVYIKDAYGCEKSVVVNITDDGTDEYERINNQNNNNKQRASAISIGTVVNARMGSGDQDWFKFSPPAGGMVSYTVSVNHPSINYSIVLYKDGSNQVRLPQSSTATSKTYLLGGGPDSIFQVQITGTTSLVCYSLLVQPALLTKTSTGLIVSENKITVEKLNTSVFPNPHRGNFGIKIESAQDGAAIIEILNAAGQLVAEKRTVVNKGGTTVVNFTSMNHNILFYRVRIGNETSTGKIIGPN